MSRTKGDQLAGTIPLNDPHVENLLEGIDVHDDFAGNESGPSADQRGEYGETRKEVDNDEQSDEDMQHEEDDIDSNAPSEAYDDIEGSDDDNIFVDKPSNKTELINKLKKMLKKARRKTADEPQSCNVPSTEGSAGWCTDPDDDDDIDTLDQQKQTIFTTGDRMKNINLERCMKFENVDVYRAALRDWTVRNGYEVDYPKNERSRVTAVCKAEGCTWRIHASVIQGGPLFQIKTLKGEHTCAISMVNKHANSKYLAYRMLDTIKDNPDIAIGNLQNSIQRKVGVEVGYYKVMRTKKNALEKIRGIDEAEYKLLWDYCETVRSTNPGSTMLLKKVPDSDPPVFSRMYFSLASMKWGFLAGCRPLIGLDGCFLKTQYGGQLLAAVGRDGNDNLFPIALAVVEVESRETWTWFLEQLLDDIGGIEDNRWTFISDRQKGLIESLKDVAPDCPHRYCLRHLYANFKEKWPSPELKTLFWKAASTANQNEFKDYMKAIKMVDPKVDPKIETASEWLNKIPPYHWARSFFTTYCKSDVLVNNLCESFNNYILEAREKPIISMFEWIRNRLTVRIQVKKSGMEKYAAIICPNILKKIKKQQHIARDCFSRWCGQAEFEVEQFGNRKVVNLEKKTCTCGMFQLMGYPCAHAFASLSSRRLQLVDYVDDYYKKDMYLKAYEYMIHAVPGKKDYIKTDFLPLAPPVYKKKPGRPKKLRRKAPDEIHRPSSRKGLTHTCKKCLQTGHNKLTCKNPTHPKAKLHKDKRTTKNAHGDSPNGTQGHDVNNPQTTTQETNPVEAERHVHEDTLVFEEDPRVFNAPRATGLETYPIVIQGVVHDGTSNMRRQIDNNTPPTTRLETNSTEIQGHVYEGRRNDVLVGQSNWRDLQEAQLGTTSQQVRKRTKKSTEAEVFQNIKTNRIWKP